MKPRLAFEVLTLFPEAIRGFVEAGLLGKAIDKGLVAVHCTNFRDFTSDKHRTVDDTPFGGGAGMVMKPEPVVAALEAVEADRGPMHKVLLTPSAPRFDQAAAHRLATHDRIALLCGRYEGIDDRVREHYVDECLSIGDFVLGGGEVAALTIIEAVTRLAEGVLGNPESIVTESFTADAHGTFLEHPQYTRPAEYRGHKVPDVLLGGDHKAIAKWREEAARQRTWALRPELRTIVPLPEDTPIHLAVPASAAPDRELLAVARTHAVAGIAVLGRDMEASMRWIEAAGGKPAVASFPSLKPLKKRLRQTAGVEPWVVAVVPPGGATPGRLKDPARVLDRLAVADAPVGRALILWLPGRSTAATLDPDDPKLGLDAVYVVDESGADGESTVASSRATLVDRTIRGLRPSSASAT